MARLANHARSADHNPGLILKDSMLRTRGGRKAHTSILKRPFLRIRIQFADLCLCQARSTGDFLAALTGCRPVAASKNIVVERGILLLTLLVEVEELVALPATGW